MKAADSVRVMNILLFLSVIIISVFGKHAWESPGCHQLGHVRQVRIPGCVAFQVTTNACRGYCVSYALPSSTQTLLKNSKHIITSRAECCNIQKTHDVKVHVRCLDGYRELTFKSAASCGCSVCRNG